MSLLVGVGKPLLLLLPLGPCSDRLIASVLEELLHHRGVGQRGDVSQVPLVAGDFPEHAAHDLPCGETGQVRPWPERAADTFLPTSGVGHRTRAGLGESWSVLDVVWRSDGANLLPYCEFKGEMVREGGGSSACWGQGCGTNGCWFEPQNTYPVS